MKILRIFGIVVAVHAAAFMFVFAIPGCRSTTRRAPSPSETAVSEGGDKRYYPGLTGYSTTTPSDAGGSSPVSNTDLNPGITPLPVDFGASPVQPADAPAVRFNPTRPNTPTASVLQTAPVADVQQVTTYTIVSGDSLWTIARKHGITVAELTAANNLKGDKLTVGKKLVIPAKATPPAAAHGSVTGDTLTYTVKSGDSLGLIARRAGTTVGAIKTLNKLKGDSVTVGQKLTLPSTSDTAAALAATAAPAAPRSSNAQDTEHIVQAHETLSQIARRYGVTQRAIGAANNISDPGRLTVGQRLVIPGASRAAAPAAPTAVPAPAPAPVYKPEPAPVSPVSPVGAPESSPISAPADQPPVVPVEGASPITPASP
jgi:LysM repeat protein